MALISGRPLHIFGDDRIFSVSELSGAIKKNIESEFFDIKLQGEISGLKVHTSGHTYLSLKDKDSVINAVLWRGTKLDIALEEGMEVIVVGAVSVYPARSQYQFVIKGAQIAGEGALLKLLNERKALFEKRGYFANNRKLPKFPKIIGIVTSKTGAVLQDMRHRLESRYPFCEVVVWDVLVQGNAAAEQIARAVRGFNMMNEKKPDIVILARGGGSIEDLWPFNEEVVVRAVFESVIPVVSAIGHETDTTLVDYAADLRAPTPTAAIELVTPVLREIALWVLESAPKINRALARMLAESRNRVLLCKKGLDSSKQSIYSISQNFDDKMDRFIMILKSFWQKERLKLLAKKMPSLASYLDLKRGFFSKTGNDFQKISKVMLEKQKDSISKTSRIFDLSKMMMEKKMERVVVLGDRLEQASFKKILKKGFCFASSSGQTIETCELFDKISANTEILLNFSDGTRSVRK